MEHIVKGCDDCILAEYFQNSGRSSCIHPNSGHKGDYIYEDEDGKLVTPSDCPLLKEPIVIKMGKE